jgi:putative membrane protein
MTNQHRRSPSLWLASLALWLAVLIATPISIWLAGDDVFPVVATLGVLSQSAATLIALISGWPTGRVLGAAATVFAGAWVVETLGSATGFPFGAYDYTDALHPQLAGVPLVISLAWFMMLIPAWAVAGAILARSHERLGRWHTPLHAAVTGAAFTAWDLYLDPQMVAHELWIWDNPEGYFGIPWINFVGWWLAASLLTLLIRPTGLPRGRLMVSYTLTWAFQSIGLGIFWGQTGPAVVGFLGMGLFVGWSWWKELSSVQSPSFPAFHPPVSESKPWTSSSGP